MPAQGPGQQHAGGDQVDDGDGQDGEPGGDRRVPEYLLQEQGQQHERGHAGGAGDDEPVVTLERPWGRHALAAPDRAGQLRLQAAGAAGIYDRAAILLDVVRSAAATDPCLARAWETNIGQRHAVQHAFAAALARKAALRPGLTVAAAADIALAILSPETYHLLVAVRGWTPDRWQAWVLDALTRQLTQPLPDSETTESAGSAGSLDLGAIATPPGLAASCTGGGPAA